MTKGTGTSPIRNLYNLMKGGVSALQEIQKELGHKTSGLTADNKQFAKLQRGSQVGAPSMRSAKSFRSGGSARTRNTQGTRSTRSRKKLNPYEGLDVMELDE